MLTVDRCTPPLSGADWLKSLTCTSGEAAAMSNKTLSDLSVVQTSRNGCSNNDIYRLYGLSKGQRWCLENERWLRRENLSNAKAPRQVCFSFQVRADLPTGGCSTLIEVAPGKSARRCPGCKREARKNWLFCQLLLVFLTWLRECASNRGLEPRRAAILAMQKGPKL